jgi:flagellar motor protein MotB
MPSPQRKAHGPLDRRTAPAPTLGQKSGKREGIYEDPLQFLWAISYSDLLMVLMSFFIIFFQMNDSKNDTLKNVMLAVEDTVAVKTNSSAAGNGTGLGTGTGPGTGTGTGTGKGNGTVVVAGAPVMDAIARQLEAQNLAVSKAAEPGVLTIDLANDLYRPGQYALSDEAAKKLVQTLKSIKPYADSITLTFIGHTDAAPVVHLDRRIIDSNLVLSNLRATRAVELALTQGFDPKQVIAQGIGEFSRNTRSLSLRISERKTQ